MNKKYIKSHSNYVLKGKSIPTKDGYIYENDLPTTSLKYNSVNNTTTTDGGFMFVVNSTSDDKKNYNTDGWNKNTFTLSTISNVLPLIQSQEYVIENKFVKLNKSYLNLKDYAYYGSVYSYLKTSVDDIINRFPAGLYLNGNYNIEASGNTLTLDTIETDLNSYIENKFQIDLNDYTEDRLTLEYNLRVFASSYVDYEAINELGQFIGNIIGFTGHTTGETNKISLLLDDNTIVWDSIIIKPKQNKIDEFFNSLDDFQSKLLNRDTIPQYKSKFVIPVENNGGFKQEYRSFIWTTSDGYNIDIDSSDYVYFMTELINSAIMSDEIYSDNLYRMLTHETIKNLDATYLDSSNIDDYIVGGTKIENLIRIYGRSFDEVKKYIEGISFVNTISYNGEDNIPNEYLSSRLETSGWDVFSLLNYIDSNKISNSNILSGSKKYFTVKETNDLIIKNLIINSKYIFKSKGTVKSIRKLFNLIGIDSDWYVINEYVQNINKKLEPSTLEKIAILNYNRKSENNSVSDGNDEFVYYIDESLFNGLNIGIETLCPICSSKDYYISGDTYGEDNTGICIDHEHVFDITGNTFGYPKPRTYDNNYYFQQKGNWYRETGGKHTDLSGNTFVNEITYGNNPHIGDGVYDNGYDYIDQYDSLFKDYVRNTNPDINLSGYTNIGFDFDIKKTNEDKIVSTESDLIMNLKNFVIGFDGDKILQSFFNNNNAIQTITNDTNSELTVTINEFNGKYVNIINYSGTTRIEYEYIQEGNKVKIHNSLNGNGTSIVFSENNIEILPGKTLIIDNTNGLTFGLYNGKDEYELIKNICLPYLEQIIPATTIFDFTLIDTKTPKWLLVDDFCERDLSGFTTGYRILIYQNINYFDTTTDMPDSSLYNFIENNFGTGYTYIGKKSKSSIFITENGYVMVMEDGSFETVEGDSSTGFDNLYLFKKESTECGINRNPVWVVDTTITNI